MKQVSTQNGPERPRRWYQNRTIQIVISLGVLALLLSRVRAGDVREFLHRSHLRYVIALLLIYPSDRAWMAWKWWLLARTKCPELRLVDAIKIYFVSSFVGLAIPVVSLGPDIVRLGMLKLRHVRTDLAVGSMLIERFIGLVATFLITAMSLLCAFWLLGASKFGSNLTVAVVLLVVGAAASASVLLLGRRSGLQWAGSLVERALTRAGLGRHWQAVKSYGDDRPLLAVNLLLAWLEQWFSVVAFYVATRAFGLDLGFWQCFAIIPVTSILMRLPVSFGGLGVRDAGVVYMAGLFGVAYADALLVSVSQFVIFVISLLPGAFWYLLERDAAVAAARST